MFALVQFLIDKVVKIVPIEDIKDHSKVDWKEEANFSRPYEVFWQSPNGSEGTGYWFAVVLLVEETKECIETRQKRVKMPPPKRLEELLGMTLNGKNNEAMVEKEVKNKRKDIQEKRNACEKEKLLSILRDKKKENKRANPFQLDEDKGEQSSSKVRRRCSSPLESSDGDELVLRSELEKMKSECERMNRKLKLKHEENIHLRKRNDKLQELNIDLQSRLLSLLSANGGLDEKVVPKVVSSIPAAIQTLPEVAESESVEVNEESSLLLKKPTAEPPAAAYFKGSLLLKKPTAEPPAEETFKKDTCVEEMYSAPAVEESNPSSTDITEEEGRNVQLKDEEIVLAPGIKLQTDKWEKVISGKNLTESRFVRNLAVAL